ncbi:hypothetical protein EV361DRAFT_312865 [Lentinula raphanica]|nr:hypothetical protein F5880DRAFT_641397 [Lentinula raphanica]KAJ3970030.1 hypothetical protein EV361DRAFT_312865 [Lentinula raphanica]
MALQTETTPTSSSNASSSSSTSSASTGNNNPDTGSFFTPTSSPPLILAFLAIGLLVTAIIAALGWRRAYFARFRAEAERQMRREESSKGALDVGKKPKLWDLWTIPGTEVKEEGVAGTSAETNVALGKRELLKRDVDHDVSWETVMPISVTPLIREIVNERPEGEELQSDNSPFAFHLFFQSRQLLGSFINHLRYRHRPRDHEDAAELGLPSATDTEKQIIEETDAEDDLTQYESLQVTVAIAMPIPRGDLKGEAVEQQQEVYEYSMGICRVPWSGAERQDSSES